MKRWWYDHFLIRRHVRLFLCVWFKIKLKKVIVVALQDAETLSPFLAYLLPNSKNKKIRNEEVRYRSIDHFEICAAFLVRLINIREKLQMCNFAKTVCNCSKRTTSSRQILRPNKFLNRKSALRSCIIFESPKVVHRPRSDSPVHFDTQNIYQIRIEK